MKFGICLPIRRDTSLEFNVDLGKTAEELGFDSVWASDHVVIPDNAAGRFSKVFYDPLVTLAAIASATRKIMIGTSVIILPYRNPVVLAKSLATLDNLSGGRLIFGIAAGWLEEEFNTLGVAYDKRGELTDEYLEAIIELWENDEPEYQGKNVSFRDISFYPKPLQKPHPPIWIGGSGQKVLKRCVRYGHCWHPTWLDPSQVKEKIRDLKKIASEAGRDPGDIMFSIRNRIDTKMRTNEGENGSPDHNSMFVFSGSFDSIREQVEKYRDAGVSYVVFDPVAGSDAENMKLAADISENIIKYYK